MVLAPISKDIKSVDTLVGQVLSVSLDLDLNVLGLKVSEHVVDGLDGVVVASSGLDQ